ncbi:MAG: AsmA family protein [Verrucomicrobia bacterium]|nr:AsmA family protein [Verrucomicrobiota bacterium]MBU4248054.1 AsmA family protein [Verrucomicrobiota bacterium]MBU4290210.1 AsmA family protein [Verrucomicrobiota bacterium]MBU4496728.1 AsmA family protein [Verrucomicrobiota bacterium]MCG2678450.1 AsmA family protein [Kiritimatiellia bacterium]
MKKLSKVILGVIVLLVVLALVIVLTLPLTINPLVKTAAATLGPQVLGVPVAVGDVALNPFSGRMIISRLSVGNPPGYAERPACAVDKVDVDLDLSSLLSDVIVIEQIRIEAPAISYESKDGVSNFDTIQANARKSSAEAKTRQPAGQESADRKPGKKVIIELFTLNGAQVAYSSGMTFGKAVTLPLPPVTVRDIGKNSGGASAADAAAQIINAIAGGLGQAMTAAASQSTGALNDAFKGSGATNTLQGLSKGMSGAAKGATDAASEAAQGLKKFFK